MKTRTFILLVALLATAAHAADQKPLLFLGNSYTGQSGKAIREVFKRTAPEYTITTVTPGGKNLAFHAEKHMGKVTEKKWHTVVLQCQSQTPGLPGNHGNGFQKAADQLSDAIRKNGSLGVLFQTWGRRDGDKRNPKLYKTFEIMNGKLEKAYTSAAKRNRIKRAPVGAAFALVKKQDPELFEGLYKGDGSHPSGKGAYLTACVMFQTITGKAATTITWDGGFPDQAETLRQLASRAVMTAR
ncbi:MAG: DUF4886 domain-containing protein [Verrucomicrobiota bacterium]